MKADELIRMTDAEVTEYAGQGQEAHQIARRLGKSVADFSRTAERQATVMIWPTFAIAVLACIVAGSVASVSHAASPAPPGDPFEQLKGDW